MLLLLLLLPALAHAGLRYDLNGDGAIDAADAGVLMRGLGGRNPVHDFTGDGRVSLSDFFFLADRIDAASAPVRYSVQARPESTLVVFPGWRIVVKNGNPFGVVDLRLEGQPLNFVHWSWPVGDWEWFWYEQGREAAKLIDPPWDPPRVEELRDGVVLHFERRDVLRDGIDLWVDYYLEAREPFFEIEYGIRNGSQERIQDPYVMLGFPGFTNHRLISEVADARQVRQVRSPHENFISESLADGREEYLLLRHDADARNRVLKGEVAFEAAGRKWMLTSTFERGAVLRHVYSAHTNKPWYLTSHLYAFIRDMYPGQERQLKVRYELSSRPTRSP